MNPAYIAQMLAVNTQVNSIPFNAIPAPGEDNDVWKDTPDGGTWVCRDSVVLKASKMRDLGWAREALTVVTCYTETGERHAVLAVDGDGETWIMDSRFDQPYPFDSPPAAYRWESRQIAGSVHFAPIA